MFGLLTRLVGGAVAPLADQFSDLVARLAKKLALFFVAFVCLIVVVIALTIAFDLWVASHAGAIVGALAVAGLYLSIALIAVVVAIRDKPRSAPIPEAQTEAKATSARATAELDNQIDQFTAPLMALLQKFGLRREQLAVLAGASVAKQIGPLPLVGLTILAGFLVGRMATGWRNLLSLDAITAIFASGLFDLGGDRATPEAEDQA